MNGKPLLKKGDAYKVKSVSKLKKELDSLFSKYIRTKYSKNDMVSCYTCGVTKSINEMQCGHFISRLYLATRFDEDNCRPQCVGCNVFGNGKPVQFANRLESEGICTKTLYKKAQGIIKDFPYVKLIEEYKAKLDSLQ